ncbi:hypothetical protein ATI45_2633 [Marinobacter sp. LV10MA510-1]|nr:hypothetical protein ATI45_2633 [Marinobacter sp. LV10MA510-1]PFG52131.1 hypothetical protein ATG98_1131 [Marinobacter sp. LV10R520-4]
MLKSMADACQINHKTGLSSKLITGLKSCFELSMTDKFILPNLVYG